MCRLATTYTSGQSPAFVRLHYSNQAAAFDLVVGADGSFSISAGTSPSFTLVGDISSAIYHDSTGRTLTVSPPGHRRLLLQTGGFGGCGAADVLLGIELLLDALEDEDLEVSISFLDIFFVVAGVTQL